MKPSSPPAAPAAAPADAPQKLEAHEVDAYARDLAMKALQIGVEAGVPADKMALSMLFNGFLTISELTSPEAAAAVADMFAHSLRIGELRLPKRPA